MIGDRASRFHGWSDAVSPIWLVLAAAIVIASVASDRFLSPANVTAVLHQGVVTGVVALGMTIVLIGGHFDLSAGAIVMMAAVFSLALSAADAIGAGAAILLPLACGAIVGMANGLVVYAAGANSIVATIGMQFALTGIVLAAVSGQNVRAEGVTDFFWGLSNARWFGVPVPVLLFVAIVAILGILMSRTVFGRHVYAIGGDIEAARRAGVRVAYTGVLTFVLSGVLAALAGVLIASRVNFLDPTSVARYEFPALTAAVLGGTSLAGGVGRPADTAAAILVVAILVNVMTILNFQYSTQLLAQGIVLTLAVAFYAWRRGGG